MAIPVKALATGFYGGRLRYEGDKFPVKTEKELGSWMQRLDQVAEEPVDQLEEEVEEEEELDEDLPADPEPKAPKAAKPAKASKAPARGGRVPAAPEPKAEEGRASDQGLI